MGSAWSFPCAEKRGATVALALSKLGAEHHCCAPCQPVLRCARRGRRASPNARCTLYRACMPYVVCCVLYLGCRTPSFVRLALVPLCPTQSGTCSRRRARCRRADQRRKLARARHPRASRAWSAAPHTAELHDGRSGVSVGEQTVARPALLKLLGPSSSERGSKTRMRGMSSQSPWMDSARSRRSFATRSPSVLPFPPRRDVSADTGIRLRDNNVTSVLQPAGVRKAIEQLRDAAREHLGETEGRCKSRYAASDDDAVVHPRS